MDKKYVVEHDLITGVVIEREMTEAEYAQNLLDQQSEAELKEYFANAKAIKESAQAKLATLGLTPEEISALVG